MKKVLAITLMLLLLATAAMAAENSWRIVLKADNGAGQSAASGGSAGVYPTSLEEWDAQDGTSVYGGISGDLPGTNIHVAMVVPGKADLYGKSIKAPTNPVLGVNSEKTWDLYVGANVNATASVMRFMAYTQGATALPTATFGTVKGIQYFLRMVDNKGVAGAPANGTQWEIPIPTAHSTAAFWTAPINLPVVKIGEKSNAGLIAGGYKMQFVQAVVPEPSSMLALGTGLMGLVGFAARRRRA